MYIQKLTIAFPEGLHVGPAYQFVKLAKQYPCAVYIRTGHGTFTAKSGLGVLRAGVGPGGSLELICDGEREAEAGFALAAYLTGDQATK